jgi:excisionase family DNA binding protein
MLPTLAPRLLSIAQAAIYLGRTEKAVRHLIARAELPVVRHGRRVHLDRAEIDRWIERLKR